MPLLFHNKPSEALPRPVGGRPVGLKYFLYFIMNWLDSLYTICSGAAHNILSSSAYFIYHLIYN
jgi:hypothetical protein